MAQRVLEFCGSKLHLLCMSNKSMSKEHKSRQAPTTNCMFLTLLCPFPHHVSSRVLVLLHVPVYTHTWRTEGALMNHSVYCTYWYHSMAARRSACYTVPFVYPSSSQILPSQSLCHARCFCRAVFVKRNVLFANC